MVSSRNRELTTDNIERISSTYRAWKDVNAGTYVDVDGFCRSVSLSEVLEQRGVLTPGRYVGLGEVEDDGETFEAKMERLVGELAEHFARGEELQKRISRNLKELGYEL